MASERKRSIHRINSAILSTLRIKAINVLFRALLRPIAPVLPERFVNRVPLVGKVRLRLPNSTELILTSDGTDSMASKLDWRGADAHEPETVRLYYQLLKHSDVVFDIGAHTGLFALIAATDRRDREVHAFEAVPRNYARLLKNVEANNLRNLSAVCGAVTKHDGEVTLYVSRRLILPFDSSIQKDFRETTDAIVVPAISLDRYVLRKGIAKVDLLKIDTEATEPEVLQGSMMILKRDKPMIICEVLPGLTEHSLQRIFCNTEYIFFHITGSGLIRRSKIIGDELGHNRNYLFITSTKMDQIGLGSTDWVACAQSL